MKTYNVIDKDTDFVGTISAKSEDEAVEFVRNLKSHRLYAEELEYDIPLGDN